MPLRDPEPAGSPLILKTRYQSKRDHPTVMPFKPGTESPLPSLPPGLRVLCMGRALHEQGKRCARMDDPGRSTGLPSGFCEDACPRPGRDLSINPTHVVGESLELEHKFGTLTGIRFPTPPFADARMCSRKSWLLLRTSYLPHTSFSSFFSVWIVFFAILNTQTTVQIKYILQYFE